MANEDSFPQLLGRVREGDDDAAAVIFHRFVNQLAAHARRHLAPAIRRQTDSEDVVQSVYRTFFRRAREGQFQLDHWGSLWGLLARITVRKCARIAGNQKNRPRQISLSTGTESASFDPGLNWEAIARDPSPAETAALDDTLDALLNPLRDSHRKIVLLTLEGYTQEEIGNRVGCSERTVRRVLAQAQSDLEKLEPLDEQIESG
ncbi:MAG TPA: sigma-70 family RNA polymerase sigma factor [Planctomycetaceae bacterium]|nr:sigma-70 family RNA polymerase sigma factor [Planctomycetaceae bacterium]